MTTILKVKANDLNPKFFQDLGKQLDSSAEVEIRISEKKEHSELFSDAQFWEVIDLLNWSGATSEEILLPAAQCLAEMPVVSIYLFADKLSEKLYLLDTRKHGDAYLAKEKDDYLSVDDFLYVRCAVVAEGKTYFENVLNNPAELSSDISFEPLLHLPDEAYRLKTGRTFDYHPVFNYETFSNVEGWR